MYTQEQIQKLIAERKRVNGLISDKKPSFSFMDMMEKYIDDRIAALISELKPKDGLNGYNPIKGKDYFTPEEIKSFLAYVTPKKGVHYFDGVRGVDGKDGRHGKDGKDGKDGKNISLKDAKMILEEMLKEQGIEEFAKMKDVKDQFKEFGLSSSKSLEKRLNALQDAVMRNYGGHGGKQNFVYNEVVSGSGTSWTLGNTPVAGKQSIFALGQRLTPTTDYTISGANITTVSSWLAGEITADYQY